MSQNPRYFDLFSEEIDKAKFDELKEHFVSVFAKHGENEPETQPLDPFSVREYRNERLCVKLVWVGEVSGGDCANLFKSMYPIFKVLILNHRDGEWRQEPIEHSYAKRKDADSKFEDVIISYTESYYDECGEFKYDESNLSKCIHETITKETLEDDALPTITYKPQTVITDGW